MTRRFPLQLAATTLALFVVSACPAQTTKKDAEEPDSDGVTGEAGNADDEEPPDPPAVRLDDTIVPESYAAHLWISPNKPDFRGELTIEARATRPTSVIWLNATRLKIEKADWMTSGFGSRATAKILSTSNDDFVGLDLGKELPAGPVKLIIKYTGETTGKDFAGAFVQEQDGKKYLFTQFEAIGARRVFPSFDQPEFKTPWKLALTVPEGDEAFANTPEEERKRGDGETTIVFKKTRPLPSYLVAFAVGPFEIVDGGTAGRNKTPLRVIVPAGKKAETAYAIEHMATTLTWLEDYFNLPYPYAKLDSIALPTFFGAMENPGLITYASGILLTKPDEVTQGFRERHGNVVAHELAHQWFGNLVTLRWWDDIWLNESFASWLAGKAVHAMHPDWNGEVTLVQGRDASMGADILESARKIRQPVESKADISGAFDGITYGKGAVVIAMFESWIGEKKFRKGMRKYMRKHKWKTTTAKDFFRSLAKVSDDELPVAFSTFLDQTGVPVVSVKLECSKGSAKAVLTQSRYVPTGSKVKADSATWQVPVCVRYGAGSQVYDKCQLMKEKTTTIDVGDASACPRWILGNAGSRGYYRVAYEGTLLKQLLKAERKLTTAERIGVIGDVGALMGSGSIEVGTALALVPRFTKDKNPLVMGTAANIASGVSELVPQELEKNYHRFIGRMFGRKARQLGWNSNSKDTRETRSLRSTLVPLVANKGNDKRLRKQALALARKWITDRKAIDRDSLGDVLRAAASSGDEDLYGKLFAEAKVTKDPVERAALTSALGSFSDKKLTARSLELFLKSDFGLRETFGIMQVIMSDSSRREDAYKFIKDNYDAIAGKMPAMARGFLVFVAVPFCDAEHKKDAQEFFGSKTNGNERTLAQAMEAIDLCIAQREKQLPELTKFLKKY